MATAPTLTVHRSASEIGGNVIEIEHDGHRLLLDAGSPLEPDPRDPDPIPPTLDLDRKVDAVVISHPHRDHFGILTKLPQEWKIWCGEGTEALVRMNAAMQGERLQNAVSNFESGVPFDVGPFHVTPFLTDHSAFDAYMLLVDVGWQRILYSGDFRWTGRKSVLVDRFLENPPRDVDVLLLEGTTLGRTGSFPTESELETQFLKLFQATEGRVFVSWSAQNIDRTVTIYRACIRANRTLILDLYSLDVLSRLPNRYSSIPRLGSPHLRGVVTPGVNAQYNSPDKLANPSFVEGCCTSGYAMSASKLESTEHRNVIMLRPSLFRDYKSKGVMVNSRDTWAYSMWSGYLKDPEYQKIQCEFAHAGASFQHIHTSGHASPEDLKLFADTIAAKWIVPIHSFEWDKHLSSFPSIMRLKNGESWCLG